MSKPAYTIIHENEGFVAVNKPSGMLSIPDRANSEPSLKQILNDKYGQIYTVHRLDKDTSGLIIFAKNEESHKYLSGLFEDRKVKKFYAGIVLGLPAQATGRIEAPISESTTQKGTMVVHRNGKPSLTTYEVLEGNRFYSLVSFELHTGRTHQIRVHTKHIGHPLACDPIYGDGKPVLLSTVKKNYKLSKHELEERPIIDRLALHSYQLMFEDQNGNAVALTAPVPKTFSVLMKQIK